MTQLFFRFYIGVLVILFAAATIQNLVTQQQNEQHNFRVIEQALGGGARLARESFRVFPEIPQDEMLELVQEQFSYPVTIMAIADVPGDVRTRFSSGDDVVFHGSAAAIFTFSRPPAALP